MYIVHKYVTVELTIQILWLDERVKGDMVEIVSGQLPRSTIPHRTGFGLDEWFYSVVVVLVGVVLGPVLSKLIFDYKSQKSTITPKNQS